MQTIHSTESSVQTALRGDMLAIQVLCLHKLEDGGCILYIIRVSDVMSEQILILGGINSNSLRRAVHLKDY